MNEILNVMRGAKGGKVASVLEGGRPAFDRNGTCPACGYTVQGSMGHPVAHRPAFRPGWFARLLGDKPLPERLITSCLICNYSETKEIK